MRRFISGPGIMRLTGTPRATVNDRLHAGTYGHTFRRGRVLFADVEGVEDYHGVTFEEAQIEAATAGRLDRLIAIPMPKPETPAEAPDAP
jgi:hypothetical protein